MNEGKKIYIVTSGEYSGYEIERVFSTKEKAQEYLDTRGDNFRLEEYDLDEPVERKTQTYCISFEPDKKKVIGYSVTYHRNYNNLIRMSSYYFNKKQAIDIFVESDSTKRAIKIASERYGAVIANEQTMYPYLRFGVIYNFGSKKPAFFDFNTGELVLVGDQQLAVELPAFIKVKHIKEDRV
ncbi:MAG: hypothetical protein IJ111_09075 [Eggerthellaceae bacterium]|nr:hypothetical protein [Eggerthellaceae bacterium]